MLIPITFCEVYPLSYLFIPPLLGSCAALVVAWLMILTYNLLLRSFSEIHTFRRHEAWKKEIFKAWRR